MRWLRVLWVLTVYVTVDVFFFKKKTAYEISACRVGSEMCKRDRIQRVVQISPIECCVRSA